MQQYTSVHMLQNILIQTLIPLQLIHAVCFLLKIINEGEDGNISNLCKFSLKKFFLTIW